MFPRAGFTFSGRMSGLFKSRKGGPALDHATPRLCRARQDGFICDGQASGKARSLPI